MKNKGSANIFRLPMMELRNKKKVSIEQLCEGLCSPRMAWYLEKGEREPDIMLQERLLERLGKETDDYKCYIPCCDYVRWEARQNIAHEIISEEIEEAERLLEKYYNMYNMEDKLEKQFYLSMLALIRQCQNQDMEMQQALFWEAVSLTVPSLDKKPLNELLLSVKEINLLLEAEHCKGEYQRTSFYQEILEYLDKGLFDSGGMAKIYPKAVYFLCQSVIAKPAKNQKYLSVDKMLALCNRALAYLHGQIQMHYLYEILDMRERLLNILGQQLRSRSEYRRAESLNSMQRKNTQWKQVLDMIYGEFHVQKRAYEYCYLYIKKNVFCLNDAVRIRREALKMSQEELADGICSLTTLRRLEGKKTKPHKAIAQELFERLGLSAELTYVGVTPVDEEIVGVPDISFRSHDFAKLNFEEFEHLDEEERMAITECLRFRKIALLPQKIYGRWLKHNKYKSKCIFIVHELDTQEELEKCILLSQLCRQKDQEIFYQKELEIWLKNKTLEYKSKVPLETVNKNVISLCCYK